MTMFETTAILQTGYILGLGNPKIVAFKTALPRQAFDF